MGINTTYLVNLVNGAQWDRLYRETAYMLDQLEGSPAANVMADLRAVILYAKNGGDVNTKGRALELIRKLGAVKASRAAKLSPLSQTTQRAERQRVEAVVSRLYNALQPIADRFGGNREPHQRYSHKDISALRNIANAYGAAAQKQHELGNTALALAIDQAASAVQRAYLALANGKDEMGDRLLDIAIQQMRYTLTVAKNGKAVTRSVVRAAKRAGVKVSDESPRVIAGEVRGIQRQWIRSRQDFESSETFPAARAITLKTMDLWKRVLAQYPSVAGIAPKTRINGLLSPSGWRMVLTQKVTPHDYHNAVLTSLGTIAQYFEKQG